MKILFYSFIALLLLSCQQKTTKTDQEHDEVIYFDTEDTDMNMAIEKSKNTFNEFKEAFNANKTEDDSFALKLRFDTPDGAGEHIWIGDLYQKDGHFYGVVNNYPEMTTEVNYGDSIQVDEKLLSDWMYVSNGILKGGNTLRVMRNQMSDAEKKEFDNSMDFKIVD